MRAVNDLWVNWFYDVEKSYEVCDFHEWRYTDKGNIEIIERMPVIKVKPDLLTYVENTLNPLPIDLLKKIENVAYYVKNHETSTIKHACVLTDGKRFIAIDTNNGQIPRKKSRLTPKQERKIMEQLEDMETEEFEYTPVHKKENQFLVVPNECMVGLNRRERYMKELLFMIFDQLQSEDDLHRLRYYYLEWNPVGVENITKLNYDELFVTFFGEVRLGWSDKHHWLLKTLLKLNPLYQTLYDDEMSFKYELEEKKKWD
jgi:hypothetical protein